LLSSYIEAGIPKIQEYVTKYQDEGKQELNEKAFKHSITIQHDDTGKVSYCACDIKDGVVRMLFKNDQYGSWQGEALNNLSNAVDQAPPPEGKSETMSFDTRQGIKANYEPHIAALQAEISKIIGTAITLNPNFEANYAALEKGKVSGDWKKNLGEASLGYFKGCAKQLEDNKFGEDDMLQEGFQEAVSSNEIIINAMETLVGGGSYNEAVIADGKLHINVRIPAAASLGKFTAS
jgi:hypothetical protein